MAAAQRSLPLAENGLAACGSGVAITPSDTVALTNATRAIYVGGAGDVAVITNDGQQTITFKAVPVGTWLWVAASQVKLTGTTATNLLGLW